MKISTNIFDLQARNQLRKTSNTLESLMKNISSGKRINSASDDAAGLSISTRFTSQIRGKQKASSNVNDGLSLLQTADSASGSISNMLQRAKELAIQAANGTYEARDRLALELEFNQLKEEINKVANNTTFNGINLLNESGVGGVTQEVIDNLKTQVPYWIDDSLKNIQNVLGLNSLPTGVNIDVKFYYDDASGTRGSMSGVPGSNDYTLKLNLGRLLDGNDQVVGDTGTYPAAITGGDMDSVIAHEITHNIQFTKMTGLTFAPGETWFIEGLASAIQGRNGYYNMTHPQKSDALVSTSSWNGDYESSFAAIKTLHEITTGGIQAIVERLEAGETLDQAIQNTTQGDVGELAGINTGNGDQAVDFTSASGFINWFNTSTEVDQYLNTSTDFTNGEGAILPGQGTSNTANRDNTIANDTTIETGPNNAGAYNVTFSDITPGIVNIHTGSESNDTLELSKADLTTNALGIADINLTTITGAQSAIQALSDAIDKVSSSRATFGSLMSRLEVISDNLSSSSIEAEKTNSRIVDSDMAKEYSELTKNKVLMNSTISMMKNSQMNTQNVLQLLQF